MVYGSPPLREAVCEIAFGAAAWDGTTAGRIQARLSEYKTVRDVQDATVAFGPYGLEVPPPVSTTQLWTADDARVVQVGPGRLVVNRLQPYGDWSAFQSQIQHALAAYAEETGAETAVSVSLTYLNLVRLADDGAPDVGAGGARYVLSDYFTFYPAFGDLGGGDAREAGASVTFEENDPPARYPVSLRFLPDEAGLVQFNLSAHTLRPHPRPLSETTAWIDRTHERIEAFFEAAITDRLRATFAPLDT